LCNLDPSVTGYIQELCYRRRAEMSQQISVLYATAQQHPRADFVAALELAAEQQMYGAEYVQAILSLSPLGAPKACAHLWEPGGLPAAPAHQEVERSLSHSERYVANRESVLIGVSAEKAEAIHE
jgi:phosphopantetheinyl transferase